jgi:hypothetical protein
MLADDGKNFTSSDLPATLISLNQLIFIRLTVAQNFIFYPPSPLILFTSPSSVGAYPTDVANVAKNAYLCRVNKQDYEKRY